MSKPLTGVLIVLSNPIDGMEDEYNAWYTDIHLPEVVALPNVQYAQRFKLEDAQVPGTPTDFKYLALYGVSGEPEKFIDELMSVTFELPESFDTVNLGTYMFANIADVVGERTERSERVWLALSNPAAGQEDAYNAWYDQHLDEVVALDAFDSAQRFKLSDNQVSPDILKPSEHRYAALYDITVPGEDLFGQIAAAGFETPSAFDVDTAKFLLFKAITGVVTEETASKQAAAR
jgi:hypothetical protein